MADEVESAVARVLDDVKAEGFVAREVHRAHLQPRELVGVKAAVNLCQARLVDVLRPKKRVARNACPFHRVDQDAHHDGGHAHGEPTPEAYTEGEADAEVAGSAHGDRLVRPSGGCGLS